MISAAVYIKDTIYRHIIHRYDVHRMRHNYDNYDPLHTRSRFRQFLNNNRFFEYCKCSYLTPYCIYRLLYNCTGIDNWVFGSRFVEYE